MHFRKMTVFKMNDTHCLFRALNGEPLETVQVYNIQSDTLQDLFTILHDNFWWNNTATDRVLLPCIEKDIIYIHNLSLIHI